MCEHCCGWWEVYCMLAPMLYIKQLLNELIFPRSFSHLRWILSPCFFSLLLPLLLQDASTSLGLKIDISPQYSLSLTLFSWGKCKAYILEGLAEKTITFKIQQQISFCKKTIHRGAKVQTKKGICGDFCSLFFIKLTHCALIFSFHFRFWSQNSPFHLLHGIEAYTSSSTQIRFKSVCSQYPKEKPILLNIWTGVSLVFFFLGWLIIPAFSVQAWPYRYWFLAGYSWPRFIFLILLSAHIHQEMCWKVPACTRISLHFCFLQLLKSHLQRMKGGRQWQYRKWGDRHGRKQERERRECWGRAKAGVGMWQTEEGEVSGEGRVAELEGGGQAGVGEMRSWVKAPELPRLLCERHSAEKIDNMCPLCQGMPKTMTSSSSKLARTRGERPGLTHGSFIHYYSLPYSSFFLVLRLSLCTEW